MAFYRQALTAEEVNQHFDDWSKGHPPSLLNGDNQTLICYFPFSERTGTRIRNPIAHRDLLMRPRLNPPQKVILAVPWEADQPWEPFSAIV